MNIDVFLKKNLIVSVTDEAEAIHKDILSGKDVTEIIVDNPIEFVDAVIESGWYISYVLWWDRAKIAEGSLIGMGGPRDPRDPERFYFAEVAQLDKHFDTLTTQESYCEYLEKTLSSFPDSDLYPGFDIKKRI